MMNKNSNRKSLLSSMEKTKSDMKFMEKTSKKDPT